jgi:pimeloyl-ACP methyl ester carboxylesterase
MVVAIARQADDLPEFHAICCPTLVIVGELDVPFLEPSRAMARAIPHAELAVIPHAGHSPQFEAPDAWFTALHDFLGALVATGS